MKLIPTGCIDTKEVFHVPSGIGKALIATGVVEEYIEAAPPIQPVQWLVINGGAAGEYEPYLKVRCPECHKESVTESKVGTAHKTLLFRHCRRVDTCPTDVAERYLAAFNHFAKTFRPKLFAKMQSVSNAIQSHAVVWR